MNLFGFLGAIVVGSLLLTWLGKVIHVPVMPFSVAVINDSAHMIFGGILALFIKEMTRRSMRG